MTGNSISVCPYHPGIIAHSLGLVPEDLQQLHLEGEQVVLVLLALGGDLCRADVEVRLREEPQGVGREVGGQAGQVCIS